ncbi:hypothetical protein BDR26DRAFT_669148 [Obelidium mucronatum]|nr:hypothetical protein BDR26DRAFT_669148 [Obelidium mucronatum]
MKPSISFLLAGLVLFGHISLACKEPVVGSSAVYDPYSGAAIYFAGQICANENDLAAVVASNYVCSQPCNGLELEFVKPATGELTDTSDIPTATAFQCCAIDTPSSIMHCMGGSGSNSRSVLYRYNVRNRVWISAIPVPNNLALRTGHSCAFSQRTFYVFGGVSSSGKDVSTPFFSYDVVSGSFNTAYLGAPANRYGHQLVSTPANQLLLLFGTAISPVPSSQLQSFVFDTKSSTWFSYQSSSASGVPQILDGASCTSWSSYLNPLGGVFCFGGQTPALQANPHLSYLNLTSNSWIDLGIPAAYANKSYTPAGTFGSTISVIDGGNAVAIKVGGANVGTGVSTYLSGEVACSPVDVNDGSGSFYGIPPFGPGTAVADCWTKRTCSSTGVTGGVNGTDGSNKGLNIPVITPGWTNPPPSIGFPIVNGTVVPTSTIFPTLPLSTSAPLGGNDGDSGSGLSGWKLALAILLPLLLLLCCGLLGWRFFSKKNEKGTLPRNAPLRPTSGASAIPYFSSKSVSPYTPSPTPAGGAPSVQLQDIPTPNAYAPNTYGRSADFTDSNIVTTNTVIHGVDYGSLGADSALLGGAAVLGGTAAPGNEAKKRHVVLEKHVAKPLATEPPKDTVLLPPTQLYNVNSSDEPVYIPASTTTDSALNQNLSPEDYAPIVAGAAGAAVLAAPSLQQDQKEKTPSPTKKGFMGIFKKPAAAQEPVKYDQPVASVPEPVVETRDVPVVENTDDNVTPYVAAAAVVIPAAIAAEEATQGPKGRKHVKITKVVETETAESPAAVAEEVVTAPVSPTGKKGFMGIFKKPAAAQEPVKYDQPVASVPEPVVETRDVPVVENTDDNVAPYVAAAACCDSRRYRCGRSNARPQGPQARQNHLRLLRRRRPSLLRPLPKNLLLSQSRQLQRRDSWVSSRSLLLPRSQSSTDQPVASVPEPVVETRDVPVVEKTDDNVAPYVAAAAVVVPAAIAAEEAMQGAKGRKHVKITKVVETETAESPAAVAEEVVTVPVSPTGKKGFMGIFKKPAAAQEPVKYDQPVASVPEPVVETRDVPVVDNTDDNVAPYVAAAAVVVPACYRC